MPEDPIQPNQETAQNPKASGTYPKRRSSWQSGWDALVYILKLSKRSDLKIRHSDRVTELSLLAATTAAILCLLLHKLSGGSLEIMLLCDFFLGVSLIIYVFNRLGILTALPARQAMLTWQLIQSFTFVGIFIAINAAIVLSIILSSVSLSGLRLP